MHFRAMIADKKNDHFTLDIRTISLQDLPEGDVIIKVEYSGINYKDALAVTNRGKILWGFPMVPGIDLAGTVVESGHPRFQPGDTVLVTGYELGVAHYGGFSEYARVPGDWVVPVPKGLGAKEAMIFGTAGFTAALAVHRLEKNGLDPGQGPVLVTGATGGVGGFAVAMLSRRGYHVVASTGKKEEEAYLKSIGAAEVLSREDVCPETVRPLESQRWAAAVDSVGGKTLSYILSTLQRRGTVAACGLAGGAELHATVYPFILRGVQLIGVDSVYCPKTLREDLWEQMSGRLKPPNLDAHLAEEISLEQIPRYAEQLLQGRVRGRILVRLDSPS